MSHEESERLADDFASLGYNIIRFAGFDHLLAGTGAASSLDFQTENLDRIDYLIAALKKRGIHITFELYQSRIRTRFPVFPPHSPGRTRRTTRPSSFSPNRSCAIWNSLRKNF